MFCPVVGPRAICNLEKHSGNACQTKQHGGPAGWGSVYEWEFKVINRKTLPLHILSWKDILISKKHF